VTTFLQDEKKAKFFTGLNKEQRASLYDFLGEAKEMLTIIGRKPPTMTGALRSLSVKCQFLMTLMILRRNKTYQEVAMLFDVTTSVVSEVFKTWLQFIYCKFQDFKQSMFTKRSDIKKPLPFAFQNQLFKNIRVIIDCTEIEIEDTDNFDQHGNRHSPYKLRPTAKVLIGVTPSGAASFVSEAFEGLISDNAITVKSGFLDYIEPGDGVMADRGFKIDNLLRAKGGHLVIPPFLKGRPAFSLEEDNRTRVIAKARIHVERFNQRMKIFKFVKGPIAHHYYPLISQAVYVCCCLANFSPTLAE
jgi:hypothetical protein